ncbi:MAG TPA: tripartite tricarboxylate transporter substrate binding protein [Burkholderiales bacterium]|nr:tripartite tricarboxylate transporter substrate binding protein [Burkholderiales bacterium]
MQSLNRTLRAAALALAGACLAQPLAAAAADLAKDYPNKPVRFIVPFAPGAGTDTTARTIAQKLSDAWGQQVVVDNRTGAAGAIGVDLTAKAVPDGYTICLISASHSVNSAVNSKLPYDLTKDLAAISQASSLFYVVYLNPASVPVKSIKELVAHAKANPGKLNFGSSGTGGLQHFAGEMFNYVAGTKMTHVPYKGTAAVIPAMLAGDVQVGFGTLFGVRPHLPSGRLRALAVTTGKRTPAAPELPTVAEAGVPGYEVDQWYGVLTGAKVPAPIVRKINAAIGEALKSPDVVKRFSADGSTPTGSTPEQFGKHIRSEIAKWRKLAKAAGLQLTQ